MGLGVWPKVSCGLFVSNILVRLSRNGLTNCYGNNKFEVNISCCCLETIEGLTSLVRDMILCFAEKYLVKNRNLVRLIRNCLTLF